MRRLFPVGAPNLTLLVRRVNGGSPRSRLCIGTLAQDTHAAPSTAGDIPASLASRWLLSVLVVSILAVFLCSCGSDQGDGAAGTGLVTAVSHQLTAVPSPKVQTPTPIEPWSVGLVSASSALQEDRQGYALWNVIVGIRNDTDSVQELKPTQVLGEVRLLDSRGVAYTTEQEEYDYTEGLVPPAYTAVATFQFSVPMLAEGLKLSVGEREIAIPGTPELVAGFEGDGQATSGLMDITQQPGVRTVKLDRAFIARTGAGSGGYQGWWFVILVMDISNETIDEVPVWTSQLYFYDDKGRIYKGAIPAWAHDTRSGGIDDFLMEHTDIGGRLYQKGSFDPFVVPPRQTLTVLGVGDVPFGYYGEGTPPAKPESVYVMVYLPAQGPPNQAAPTYRLYKLSGQDLVQLPDYYD